MDFHFLIVGQIVGHFALAYPLFRQELNAPSGHPFDIVPLRLAVSRSLCPDRLFLFFPIRRIQHQIGEGLDLDAPGQLHVLLVGPTEIFQGKDRPGRVAGMQGLLVLLSLIHI